MIEDRNSIKILESYPAGPASSYTCYLYRYTSSKEVLRQTTMMYRFVCCQPKYIYILYCTFTDQRN